MSITSIVEDSGSSPSGEVGEDVDYSMLHFTATYDDESTSSVIPNSVTPPDFGEAGTIPVTFGFAGTDITCIVNYDVQVPAPVLTGLSISGDWTNFNQYVNRNVDITGLTINALYSDGTTSSLADAGLTFYGVKQKFNLQDEYERSTWVNQVSADGEVTLVAKDTNDVSYYGTISNQDVGTPLRVVYYSGSDRPIEANATFYVGDEETHIVECDNVWLYSGNQDKDFFIDLEQESPINVDEGDIFWYVMDATDYEDPTKSLADAAQDIMTIVAESGYNPEVIPNGTIPAPHGNGYRKTDLEWTIPLSGEGTLLADKDVVFVLAEAPSAGNVATFAPSDLNEWSVLHVTLKPGHDPGPTLESLEVTGSLTNTQYLTDAPDLTGLTIKAVYSDDEKVILMPSVLDVSPATYTYTSGAVPTSTTLTISYTDDEQGITATTNVQNVAVHGKTEYTLPIGEANVAYYDGLLIPNQDHCPGIGDMAGGTEVSIGEYVHLIFTEDAWDNGTTITASDIMAMAPSYGVDNNNFGAFGESVGSDFKVDYYKMGLTGEGTAQTGATMVVALAPLTRVVDVTAGYSKADLDLTDSLARVYKLNVAVS